MRQILLLGNPVTKRTVYLEAGAREAGVALRLLDWKTWQKDRRQIAGDGAAAGIFLKIDPPLWDSCRLDELDILVCGYEEELEVLASLEGEQKLTFLNHPEAIICLLDKRVCKRCLQSRGIPVTETLLESVSHPEQLLEAMEREQMSQVFLKPVRGSGAAGAAAFRYQRKTGQMVLYTCSMEDPDTGRLVNTKRLRRFTDRKQILSLIRRLTALDCMAERWYPKAEHKGYSYDLRAVVQDGQVDFLLSRLSRGPLTNLHLNNHPLAARELGLPSRIWEETEELCRTAAGCFRGLRSTGMDILLEKGSLRPRVIEMNGQGDLIYQDIYDKNKIYRHQAEMMKEWLYGKT